MLDNFQPRYDQEALASSADVDETEASGGISFQNLEEYTATGVDCTSSGAIIHQAVSLGQA